MKKSKDLNGLMEEQLRDMFDGELQLSKTLHNLKEHASDYRLRMVLEEFIEQSNEQVLYLKQAFSMLYKQKRGEKCLAIQEIIAEAENLFGKSEHRDVVDGGIIVALQEALHYQKAGYGAIADYATDLRYLDVARLMHINLQKLKQLDSKLNELAEEMVDMKIAVV